MKQLTLKVDRKQSFNRSLLVNKNARRHLILGFAVMAGACANLCGCALTATSHASSSEKSNTPELVGPDYYSSNDNPFHAD